MGTRGPLSKRKSEKSEPKPAPGRPETPDSLTEEEIKEWHRLFDILEDMDLAFTADYSAAERYVTLRVLWKSLKKFIQKNGTSFVMKTTTPSMYVGALPAKNGQPQEYVVTFNEYPEYKQFIEVGRQLLAFEIDFGLSPKARTRLTVPKKKPELVDQDSDGAPIPLRTRVRS
jgi:P27 family predicted phage terminase small subunit